jgi:hypothetical protein
MLRVFYVGVCQLTKWNFLRPTCEFDHAAVNKHVLPPPLIINRRDDGLLRKIASGPDSMEAAAYSAVGIVRVEADVDEEASTRGRLELGGTVQVSSLSMPRRSSPQPIPLDNFLQPLQRICMEA